MLDKSILGLMHADVAEVFQLHATLVLLKEDFFVKSRTAVEAMRVGGSQLSTTLSDMVDPSMVKTGSISNVGIQDALIRAKSSHVVTISLTTTSVSMPTEGPETRSRL